MKALFTVTLAHTFLSFLCSAAETPGSVMVYLDADCTIPNGTAISLSVGHCLETHQAGGIYLVSLPSCASGQPVLIVSDHELCKNPSFSPAPSSGNQGDCLSFTAGFAIGSAKFTCVEGTTTTSSTTNSRSGETGVSTAMSTSTASLETSRPSVALVPSTASTAQPSQGQDTLPSAGLSQSDKIALGCAIAFGVPALVLAYLTWRNRQVIFHNGFHHSGRLNDLPPPYELYDTRRRRP